VKTKTLCGIEWAGAAVWSLRSKKPERHLEFRGPGVWLCERLLPLGAEDVWVAGRGRTQGAAVRALLKLERRLARELAR